MVAAELAVFTQTQTCTGGRAETRAVPRPGWLVRVPGKSHDTRFPRRKAKGREGRKGQKERGKRTNIVGVVLAGIGWPIREQPRHCCRLSVAGCESEN